MDKLKITPLPRQGFRRTPWKNGGGVTIDIAGAYVAGAEDGGWDETVWRFGRTAITVPAPFSDLTGFERMQLVIEGSGLVLEAVESEIDLRQPLSPVRYDGGLPLVSRLEHGPVEVLNLIADRARCDIALTVLDAGQAATLKAGVHILYAPRTAIAASCAGSSIAVPAEDALRFDAASETRLNIAAGLAVLGSVLPK